jgi:predicted amidohydrolase
VREVAGETKRRNSHILVDSEGQIRAVYDKVHLYNLQHEQGGSWNEGKTIEGGFVIPEVVDTPVGRIGLSICYDLRFPEFYRLLMLQGAEVLTVPSAFMKVTGKDHWEVLLRVVGWEESNIFRAGQLRTNVLWLQQLRLGNMARNASRMGTPWLSILGGRCCSTWGKPWTSQWSI